MPISPISTARSGESPPPPGGKAGGGGHEPPGNPGGPSRAGATFQGPEHREDQSRISKADLYRKGLSGGENSAALRKELMKKLELPERLSAQGLLDVLNAIMSREEFMTLQL
ncbi:MAG: DUF4093 domain-containing protein [Oscillospiraceae bacterium]